MYFIKSTCYSLLGCLFSISLYAQDFSIPDGKGEEASNVLSFRENKGQVGDVNYHPVPSVKYACTGKSLDLYLLDSGRVSWVHTIEATDPLAPDSLRRLDMWHFNNDEVPTPVEASPVGWDTLPGEDNFWLPQCPNGVTGVRSFTRVVYPSIYDQIDYQVYSNEGGYKMYWVIHPGGDPSEIRVKFEGYDLQTVTPQQVQLFQNQLQIGLEQAIAYQIDANYTISPLSWQPGYVENADHSVSLTYGSYDSTKILVFQAGPPIPPATPSIAGNSNHLEWSTYLSSSKWDEPKDLFQSNQGFTYVAGFSQSTAFPIFTSPAQSYVGEEDAFIGSFTDLGERLFGTYYGGKETDVFNCGTVLPSGEILVAGYSKSDTINNIGANPAINDLKTGIIVKFDAQFKNPPLRMFFGGDHDDEIYDIEFAGNNEFLVVGRTNGPQGHFPLKSQLINQSYYQIKALEYEGFFARLNINNGSVIHSSYFGSGRNDAVTTILQAEPGTYYMAGYTESKTGKDSCFWPISNMSIHIHPFPTCNSTGNYWVQPNGKGQQQESDYFIASLTGFDVLTWSTFIGSDKPEGGEFRGFPKLAVNPNDPSKLFLAGSTDDYSTFPQASTNAYQWTPTGQNQRQGVVVRFDDRTTLDWSTFIGCDALGSVSIVEGIEYVSGQGLYVTGTTDCNQPQSRSNYGTPPTGTEFPITDNNYELWLQEDTTFGPIQQGSSESFIQAFDVNDQLAWSTWYGGGQNEQGQLISYNPGTDKLFISGVVNPDTLIAKIPLKRLPHPNSYFQGSGPGLGNQIGGYIARFQSGFTPVFVEEIKSNFDRFEVWPNPACSMVHIDLDGPAEYQIYTISGQLVVEGRIDGYVNAIYVAELSNGVYVVNLTGSNRSGSFKLVKE
ncbi:T9SS type A sorting domain-containing protein [bacterium SCSIO 12741]|nr:T9SS type A sorting domain-containing protein [bacterium SCSIO 12741]